MAEPTGGRTAEQQATREASIAASHAAQIEAGVFGSATQFVGGQPVIPVAGSTPETYAVQVAAAQKVLEVPFPPPPTPPLSPIPTPPVPALAGVPMLPSPLVPIPIGVKVIPTSNPNLVTVLYQTATGQAQIQMTPSQAKTFQETGKLPEGVTQLPAPILTSITPVPSVLVPIPSVAQVPEIEIPMDAVPLSKNAQGQVVSWQKGNEVYYGRGSTTYDMGFRTQTEREDAELHGVGSGIHEGSLVAPNSVIVDYGTTGKQYRVSQVDLSRSEEQGKVEGYLQTQIAKGNYRVPIKATSEKGGTTELLIPKETYDKIVKLEGQEQFAELQKLGIKPADWTYITKGKEAGILTGQQMATIEQAAKDKQIAQQVIAPIAQKANITKDPTKYTQSDIEALIKAKAIPQDLVNAGASIDLVNAALDKLYVKLPDNQYMDRDALSSIQKLDSDLYDIATKKGYGDYKIAFDAKYTKVGDDSYLKTTDVNKIKELNTELYDTLMDSGFVAYQNKIKDAEATIDKAGDYRVAIGYPQGGAPFESYTTEGAYGYNVTKYLIDTKTPDYKINPDSLAIAQTIYSKQQIDEIAKNVQDNLTATYQQLKDITQGIPQKFSDAEVLSLGNVLDMVGATRIPVGGIVGAERRSIQATWDNLSNDKKEQVAQSYLGDVYKGNILTEMVETLQAVLPPWVKTVLPYAELGLAVLAPPIGMPILAAQAVYEVAKPYTVSNQAIVSQIQNNTDYFKSATTLTETEIKALSEAMNNVGFSVARFPLATYQKLDANTQQKVITEYTRQQLGLTPTTMQKVMAGAMVAAVVLPYTYPLATTLASRLGLLTAHAGISGIFIAGSVPVLVDPKVSVVDKAVAAGMDALMIAGLYAGVRGTKIEVANKLAIDASKAINEALRPTSVEVAKPLTQKIGEAISDVKTEIKDIPSKIYTAPEAIKYYAKGLKIELGDLADAVKINIEQTQTERANKIIQEIVDKQAERLLSDAGVIKGDLVATRDAVKYYGNEVRRAVGDALKSVYSNLTEAKQAEANKVVQDIIDKEAEIILSGVGKGEFATTVDAIKYYSGEVKRAVGDSIKSALSGFDEAQQLRANKIIQEAIDREAERILSSVGKGEFATIADAVKYYSSEVGRVVGDSMKSAYSSLLDARQVEANKILQGIIDRESEKILSGVGKGEFATTVDAIKYYSSEVRRAIGDAMKSAINDWERLRLQQAQRMIDDVIVRSLVEGVSGLKGQELVDEIAKVYGLESKPLNKFNLWQRLISERNIEGMYSPEDFIKLVDIASGRIILHELVHPEIHKQYTLDILRKLESVSGLPEGTIGISDRGLFLPKALPDAADAVQIVEALNELSTIEYVKRISNYEALWYRQNILDGLVQLGNKRGISDLSTKIDSLSKQYIDSLRLKFTKDIGDIPVGEKDILVKLPQMLDYYAQGLILETSAKGKLLADSVSGVFRDIYAAMRVKDLATFRARAIELEELSSKVDDVKVAKWLKDKAQDLQKNAEEYIKQADVIKPEDIAKVEEVAKTTGELVRQTHSDLLASTRPLKLEDIGKDIREGRVSREVIDIASKEYDYSWEIQRQQNLERLMKQKAEGQITTSEDIQEYLNAQWDRSKNIARFKKDSEDLTMSESGIRAFLDTLEQKAKNLERLDNQIVQETIDDLEAFLRTSPTLGKREAILEEGTIPYKSLDPAQQALMDAINRDTLKLNEYQNIKGMEYESSKLINRIQENMMKLAKLREQKNPLVSLTETLETKLKEMGYTDKEISNMTGREKVERVANETPPERKEC